MRIVFIILILVMNLLPVAAQGNSLMIEADKYFKLKDYPKAEHLYLTAAAKARVAGPDSENYLVALNKLLTVYYAEKNYKAAAPIMKEVLNSLEKQYGAVNATVQQTRNNYNKLVQLVKQQEKQNPSVPSDPNIDSDLSLSYLFVGGGRYRYDAEGTITNTGKRNLSSVDIVLRFYKDFEVVEERNPTVGHLGPGETAVVRSTPNHEYDRYEVIKLKGIEGN